ncbi:hypothetical protein ACH4FX_37395 [Streptomyces sp. NPDC018019]|uniref:hypothetical protein n=1 Tax=Streptomyces sp. NPDC018019 TaxID=3365030 RepID=UPI0037A4C086
MSPADAPRLDRAQTYAETVHRIYGDRRAAPPAASCCSPWRTPSSSPPANPGGC